MPSFQPVVAYARVSSTEQEEEGFSIPAQLKFLREYAQKSSFAISEEFVDVETAKQAGRRSDEPSGTAIPGFHFTFGLTVESETRRNRDLDRDVKDNFSHIEPELNLEVEYQPANWIGTQLKLAEKGLRRVRSKNKPEEERVLAQRCSGEQKIQEHL